VAHEICGALLCGHLNSAGKSQQVGDTELAALLAEDRTPLRILHKIRARVSLKQSNDYLGDNSPTDRSEMLTLRTSGGLAQYIEPQRCVLRQTKGFQIRQLQLLLTRHWTEPENCGGSAYVAWAVVRASVADHVRPRPDVFALDWLTLRGLLGELGRFTQVFLSLTAGLLDTALSANVTGRRREDAP
jgi:hypothetical protein